MKNQVDQRLEAYLKKYRKWCRFFPVAFRKQFQPEIEQVFLTALSVAETKFGEKGIQLEYRAAVTDIIPAILHEQLTSLPTLQQLFTGKNTVWKFYIILYWPFFALFFASWWGHSDLNTDLNPFVIGGFVALYLTPYIAIWLTTAQLTKVILVAVASYLPLIIVNTIAVNFFFIGAEDVLNFGSLAAYIFAVISPYMFSIIYYRKRHRTDHSRMRIATREELAAESRKKDGVNFRRNTVGVLVLFLIIVTNTVVLSYDSGRYDEARKPSVVIQEFIPYEARQYERDNAYYQLVSLDGLSVDDQGFSRFNKYLFDFTRGAELPSELQEEVKTEAEFLREEISRYVTASKMPYFNHPSLSINTQGFPYTSDVVPSFFPSGSDDFQGFILLNAYALNLSGREAEAAELLKASLRVGMLVASGAPTDSWYWTGLSLVGKVRQILPKFSSTVKAEIEPLLPSEDQVLAARKNFLSNFALVAMVKKSEFEQENTLLGRTLLYLPNDTTLALKDRVEYLMSWKKSCAQIKQVNSEELKRYESREDSTSYVREAAVTKLKAYFGINGAGKAFVDELFASQGSADKYAYWALGAQECYATEGTPLYP